MKVRLHPAAAEEFLESVHFYSERVEGLGERFLLEFERLSGLLSDFPELGAPHDQNFRRLLMTRFPFSIVYSIESDVVWIIAVAHHRRKPGYWKSRAPRR